MSGTPLFEMDAAADDDNGLISRFVEDGGRGEVEGGSPIVPQPHSATRDAVE